MSLLSPGEIQFVRKLVPKAILSWRDEIECKLLRLEVVKIPSNRTRPIGLLHKQGQPDPLHGLDYPKHSIVSHCFPDCLVNPPMF